MEDKEYSKIELTQVDLTDAAMFKEFANSMYAQMLGFHEPLSTDDANSYITSFQNSYDKYIFAVRVQWPKDYKKSVVGFSFIRNVDWTARHAEILNIQTDENKNLVSPDDSVMVADALKMLVKYGFETLNLEKLYIEVFDGANYNKTLESIGFHVEGSRRLSKVLNGERVNSTVFAILRSDFK